MARYIDKEETLNFFKGIEALHHNDELRINILNGINAISSTTDVVEREKIDKAIEVITRLRDSTERMITEDVSVANECYEQYVNCYDECLRIIKQNIGD